MKKAKKTIFFFCFYICIIYIKGRQVAKACLALLKETHGVRVELCMGLNVIRYSHLGGLASSSFTTIL